MITRFTFLRLLFAFLVLAGVAQAQNAPNFYSNVVVINETQKPIAIQTGWHGESWNDIITIQPGKNQVFDYRYRFPNENRSPWFLLGIYNAASGHKVNYHIYATPAPVNYNLNAGQCTVVRIRGIGNNLYAEGDPSQIQRGHWESYKLRGEELGGWNRLHD